MSSPSARGVSQLCPRAGSVPDSLPVPTPLAFTPTHPRSLPARGETESQRGQRILEGQRPSHRDGSRLTPLRLVLAKAAAALPVVSPVPHHRPGAPEMSPAALAKETEDLGEGWPGAVPRQGGPTVVPKAAPGLRGTPGKPHTNQSGHSIRKAPW